MSFAAVHRDPYLQPQGRDQRDRGESGVHGLPIFIVDDGSDEATQHVLAALQQHADTLTLMRLPVNGGKGAAVMAGLRAARKAGFTHGLQIDADGQHDSRRCTALHRSLRSAAPRAVILGRPVYDDSVPKSRLYGRYLTHVWVWIETLSLTIRDSMCGFRLYPLDIGLRADR
jgi:glycosyltransferase involved in cell wall biosynthesis